MAHTIIKAETSHHLPSESWRPRKAGGVVQFESEVLRTRGGNGVSPSLSPKAQEPGALMSEDRRRQSSQLKKQERYSKSPTYE